MSKYNPFGWHYEWLDNSIYTISLPGMATDKDNLFRGEARYLAHVCALTLPKGFTEQSAIEIYSVVIAHAVEFSCDEKYEKCDTSELSIEATSQELELTKNTILVCEGVASLLFAISLYESKKKEDAWAQLLHCQSLIQEAAQNNAMAQEVITKHRRQAYDRMMDGASKGGKSHHATDRQAFKDDYRADRDNNPGKPRAQIITDLNQYYCPKLAISTLENWAKQADDEDGFVRKGGRPKKR